MDIYFQGRWQARVSNLLAALQWIDKDMAQSAIVARKDYTVQDNTGVWIGARDVFSEGDNSTRLVF